MHFEQHVRILAAKFDQVGREQVHAAREADQQAQGAAGLAALVGHEGVGFVDLFEDVLAAQQVFMARFGQLDAARGAVEQARAQVLLEVDHEPAQHGCAHVQLGGRARETARAGNLAKHPHRL